MDGGNLEIPRQLYRNLSYYHWNPSETVIKYGETGDSFFILIKGDVEVRIYSYFKMSNLGVNPNHQQD